MTRSPSSRVLAATQGGLALLFCGLCVIWMFRTREIGLLGVETNLRGQETAQLRQGFMNLLQDTAVYSERSPAMRVLLQQLGVRVTQNGTGGPSASPASTPAPSPANRR
jgi:hypothetical protein